MQKLQLDSTLGWDDKLGPNLTYEWKLIVSQINSYTPYKISRCLGKKDDKYNLLCFTDASRSFCGSIIYMHNLNLNKLFLIGSQNRVISTNLKNKTIPALEMNALALGTEHVLGVYSDLCGRHCLVPIKINEIFIFSDSLCCISWLQSAVNNLDKMSNVSVFVKNKIKFIQDNCRNHTII